MKPVSLNYHCETKPLSSDIYIYRVDGKHGTDLKINASMIVELVKFHRGFPRRDDLMLDMGQI